MCKLITLFNFMVLGVLLQPNEAFSQGGGGARRNLTEVIAKEKQLVLDSVSGINEDRKLIIEEIYKDYEESMAKLRANADPDNREAMRIDMMAIRDGKNDSLKAILTEEQFLQYEAIMKVMREKMGQRRRNNGGD